MNTASTAYPIATGNIITTGDIIYPSPYAISYNTSGDLYGEFISSLDEVKEKNVLMHHSPSEVKTASKLFPGYLTDEELQKRQCKGRFWDVTSAFLYILVDNETLVIVGPYGDVKIAGREKLPVRLQGRYYYDEY